MAGFVLRQIEPMISAAVRSRRVVAWAIGLLVLVAIAGLQQVFPQLRLDLGGGVVAPSVWLMVLLASMACEYVDAALGMGYGTTLTVLLLMAGFAPLQIVPCVLLSQLVCGALATAMHHRDGNVDFLRDGQARRSAMVLSSLSFVGALAAVVLALRMDARWLSLLIALIVLGVGLLVLATARRTLRFRPGHLMAVGLVAAFNKGISGGGYGPLITSGQVVSGTQPRQAIAIAALAETVTCVVGLGAYLLLGGGLDWALAFPLVLGAVMSVPLATLTVRRIPGALLRYAIGGMTTVLGLVAVLRVM